MEYSVLFKFVVIILFVFYVIRGIAINLFISTKSAKIFLTFREKMGEFRYSKKLIQFYIIYQIYFYYAFKYSNFRTIWLILFLFLFLPLLSEFFLAYRKYKNNDVHKSFDNSQMKIMIKAKRLSGIFYIVILILWLYSWKDFIFAFF
jgi:hypothetical protein